MKKRLFLLSALLCACSVPAETPPPSEPESAPPSSIVISEDVSRFWEAYDAVRATDDPSEKLRLLNALYIDPGTPGLHAMNRARSYRTSEFITLIDEAPTYWDGVRANTARIDDYAASIEAGLERMRGVYDSGAEVPVYFVIGAMRTAGTANDGKLLIGAELAMADASVPTDGIAERYPHLVSFVERNPLDGLVALNLHEYVHTQQRGIGGADLLSQALFEGLAEYLSTEAIGEPSKQPSIVYGLENRTAVLDAFEADIGKTDYSGWIWNSAHNAFGVRDLGYYAGYAVAADYIANASDADAVKTLMELDYTDLGAVDAVVDAARTFGSPVAQIRARNGHDG